jgi:hypothetical protein
MSLMFLASWSHFRLLAMTQIACCTILLSIRHLLIRHSPSHTRLHFASILLSTSSDLSSFTEGPTVNQSRLQASAAQRNAPPLAEESEAPPIPLKLFSLGSVDLLNSATESPRKPAVTLRQLCRAQSGSFRMALPASAIPPYHHALQHRRRPYTSTTKLMQVLHLGTLLLEVSCCWRVLLGCVHGDVWCARCAHDGQHWSC